MLFHTEPTECLQSYKKANSLVYAESYHTVIGVLMSDKSMVILLCI